MKQRLSWVAAITGVVAACAITQVANASPITFAQDQVTIPGDTIVTPSSTTPNFTLSTTGSISNVQLSPYSNNTSTYSCLNCPSSSNIATATYVLPNDLGSGLSIFWGSPDAYNSIEFFDGATLEDTVTGNELLPPTGTGHNLVTFSFNGTPVTSVVLTDSETAAFEYSNILYTDVAPTPLPAALPLFAGGLGLIGLLSRRRKRQAAGALPA